MPSEEKEIQNDLDISDVTFRSYLQSGSNNAYITEYEAKNRYLQSKGFMLLGLPPQVLLQQDTLPPNLWPFGSVTLGRHSHGMPSNFGSKGLASWD